MKKIYYNLDFLNEYCLKNNVTLKNNYDNIKLTRETIIEGYCIFDNCKDIFQKKILYMKKYGAYCEKCTKINRKLNYKKTCLEKYGVENLFQSEKIKQKLKETNIKKYGVENPTHSNEIREKTKQKNLKKYGVEHTCQLEHVINMRENSILNKYGVKYPFQSEIYKNNFKLICLEKYGVENPQQVPEIAEKSSKNSYKRKTYTFPSGNKNTCQGYEPLALDKLINEENINENDIVTGCKNVPTIWYNDDNGKKHRHYVDIFIPSQNRCIEVKSTWTAKKNEDKIYLKQDAAKELGYNYEIWIYNAKKELVECYK
jgi:hypothetical protein